MQKSNKKDQGCRKMAKNYCVGRARRELAPSLRLGWRHHGLKQPRALSCCAGTAYTV